MSSPYGRWLWLLSFALCIGAVLYVIRPDPGHVDVQVIERSGYNGTLLIHNGTRHRVYMSDFSLVSRPGTASMHEEHIKPNAVEPNSEKTWVVNLMDDRIPGVVFLPPWTNEEAEQAKARAQPWPKPIREWLLRNYKPRDPRYLHTVEVPAELKNH